MARPQIPASILANRGVPIKLMTGREVVVCYTFKSLMLLEEQFGSIQAALEIIANPTNAQFAGIAKILACGLVHEVATEADGQGLGNVDVLADLLDSAELKVYADAMGEAFSKSFPTPDPEVQADADPTLLSLGESGTSSPGSHMASPMASSGP
jgi:hypothetical protein